MDRTCGSFILAINLGEGGVAKMHLTSARTVHCLVREKDYGGIRYEL